MIVKNKVHWLMKNAFFASLQWFIPKINTKKNPSPGNSRSTAEPCRGRTVWIAYQATPKPCVDQCHSRLAPERAMRYPAIM